MPEIQLTADNLYFFAIGIGLGVLLTLLFARMLLNQQKAISLVKLKASLDVLENTKKDIEYQYNKNEILSDKLNKLQADRTRLEAQSTADRQRYEEQIQLLQQARASLTQEFENLANRIFDDKQQKFSEQSSSALMGSIDPLRREIHDFRKKVEHVYDKENADRNKLAGQIVELQKQTQQVGEDAVHLANALKGDSKFQGNWGEMILERILEQSGLSKGREYAVQVALQDGEGKRKNPDVVLHLPDNRDIIIDAKVSLTDYERYCREDDPAQQQQFIKQHVNSIRQHINGLSRKAYEQLEGVNSLDFVLIFIPVEAAFMLAVEQDQTLFHDAYDKGVILVSPSTLLATLRTICNIWRYEDQNNNAQKIAAEAGKLYDQFALVVESLDELGQSLEKSQVAWQKTRQRLVDGRGNAIKKLESLKKLGARTGKQLPQDLVEQADETES